MLGMSSLSKYNQELVEESEFDLDLNCERLFRCSRASFDHATFCPQNLAYTISTPRSRFRKSTSQVVHYRFLHASPLSFLFFVCPNKSTTTARNPVTASALRYKATHSQPVPINQPIGLENALTKGNIDHLLIRIFPYRIHS